MDAYTFNIKGQATISFADSKPDMTSNKAWQFINTIWRHFPEKLTLYTSVKRGATDKTKIEDSNHSRIISDMINGCIETCDITLAGGRSVSIFLGSCYEYTLPFGTSSVDTGHQTMITVLPIPLDGCYTLSGQADGYFKKSFGKEHYMIRMNLDIYIGKIANDQVQGFIDKGYKVFPMAIRHPEHFPKSTMSDSEMETEGPSEDDAEEDKNKDTGKRMRPKSLRALSGRRGIIKKVRGRTPSPIISAIKSSISHQMSKDALGHKDPEETQDSAPIS